MNQIINNSLTGLNKVGSVFYDYAASVFIQTALLVILLFVIDLLLRKRVRAVFRYCLWLLVLLKLVLPPMISLPTGIGYWIGDHIPAAAVVSNGTFDTVALEHARPSGEIHRVRSSENVASDNTTMASADTSLTSLTWQAVVFLLWLAGVSAFLAVLVQRIMFVRGLVAASCTAGDELTGLLEQCRRQMIVKRDIKLRLSGAVPSPAVCGLLRPIVLMPVSLVEKLSPEGLRAALIHELAHIKRYDLWVNSVQTFLQVVYFYNPFVWFANSMIRKVCEEAVDETVLVALGGQAKHYSNILIDIGETVFWKADLGLRLIGVAESKKALQWRIRHMLNRPIPKTSKLGLIGMAMLLVIAAILLPMAKAQKLDKGDESKSVVKEGKSTKSLHEAAADGDIEQVRSLISRGANVNAKDDTGKSPLHEAAYYGQKEAVEMLIAKGANVNATDASGQTPLHLAVTFGSTHLLELLVAGGADVNARDNRGNTPLHTARGKVESMEFLLAKGADVNARNNRGEIPLHVVVRLSRVGIAPAKLLLANGANVNAKDNNGNTPLHNAAYIHQKNLVEMLVTNGAMIDEKANNGSVPLHAAAMGGRYDVVEFLLDKGADINIEQSNGRTALHHAAGAGYDSVAELLISRGANLNTESNDGETPLDAAAMVGTIKLCSLLIEKGAKIDSLCSAVATGDLAKVESFISKNPVSDEMDSALCAAAASGREDVAELLIRKGAHANAKNRREETALHLAARGGYIGVAKLLIANGADVNAATRLWRRQTPLHYAVRYGHRDMVMLLLDNEADVNAGPERWGRAVYYASQGGHEDLVRLLIDRGADLPSIDLFFSAVSKGQNDLVEFLIKKGIDVNIEDKHEWVHPPSLYAIWRGHVNILTLLLDHGANANAQDKWGWSLLHYSAGSPDLTKLLLDKGADPHIVERERGRTPLHIAAEGFRGEGDSEPKDYSAAAQLLIAHGADVNAKNWDSKTPLALAQEKGRAEMVELLRKHGADE